ncbi:MAG TPA: elongation factor G [Longimicrobiales bacterium]|nr:elongation factor G [Longimicrobiales bacterium]
MATAKEYPTDRIRNVAVLGHGGSGKTTLVDALCFVTGTTRRHGSIEDGTALTMFTPEEIGHGISMQTTPAFADWEGTKVNLLDTPGYMDFTGEALAATRVTDGAVLVLGATTGVEVGTEKVWEYCESRGIPRLFFVSMMDKENADFDSVYADIKEHLTEKVIPVEIPIGAGDGFRGIINLFSGRAHIYKPGSASGEYEETDIPEEKQAKFEKWRTELMETIATTDDSLLEAYLEGGEIDREQALHALKTAMGRGEIFPLFCGAPQKTWGTRALIRKLVELMPCPADAASELAQRPNIDQVVELRAADDTPFAALVYKTMSEPHVGELSFFRVFSGMVENGQDVLNANREATEKLAHISIAQGKDRLEVNRLHAGDLGVVAKLKSTHTNDTLCHASRPLVIEPIRFPAPDIAVAVRAASRSDEDKLGTGLHRLHEEDPTFASGYDVEVKQTIIRGLGELHLDVQIERLKRKYGVEVTTEQPLINYRETIRKSAEAHGRYKKQTGGRGQFGDCHVRLNPLPRGSGYQFTNSISGGVIPGKFIPSVDRGIQDAAGRGVIAGFTVVDFEAECFDGSYHTVDSSDVAFQVAGSMAFKQAARSAAPVLLEPVMEVEITTPEDFMGDIMGDLNQRRGKIQGLETQGGKTIIRALVPEAELYKYATTLRSMSHGRAFHTRQQHGYEEVPPHVAERITAETDKAEEAEVHA